MRLSMTAGSVGMQLRGPPHWLDWRMMLHKRRAEFVSRGNGDHGPVCLLCLTVGIVAGKGISLGAQQD